MNLIVAGASFPCGVGELGKVALTHGFTPIFIEHPHNTGAADSGLTPLRFETEIPDDVIERGGILLPLLESWVSEGLKVSEDAGLRFDKRAAKISRSKQAISATLAAAGITHVRRSRVDTIGEAFAVASEYGYPTVLRSDTGYSGRGIRVATSANDLGDCWASQANERVGADFAEMRSLLDSDHDVNIIEPWLPGDEWSIDCVVGPGGVYLIRVCEKMTIVMAGRPVTLGYRIVDDMQLLDEIRKAVQRWCSAIFHAGIVSFACFDIRRHSNGDLVPLDFGARLGGDCIPLLVRHAGGGQNPYAAALAVALTADPRRLVPLSAGLALVHAYARQPGSFSGLAVVGHGEVIDSRPFGFVVRQTENMPVHRRVGSVLTCFRTRDEFRHACQSSADWLQVNLE
jgi:hypothetical protein